MTFVLDVPAIKGEAIEETLGRIAIKARGTWRHRRTGAILMSACTFSYIMQLVFLVDNGAMALLLIAAIVLMTVWTVSEANKAILNKMVALWATKYISRILITKAVTEQAESVARLFNQEQRGNLLSHPDPEQLG